MSLSDCEKCWNTPCTCGYEYKKYSTSLLLTLKEVIDKELDDRKNQHDEDIKPDNPGICKIEYLTVEEMKKIYGIEVTDLTIKLPEECKHPGCRSHVSHPCEECGTQWIIGVDLSSQDDVCVVDSEFIK